MIAKKCDRCGKFYEATRENVYLHEQQNENGCEKFPINSVRIGFWDAHTRSWRYIASAYDLCPECAKEITEVIMKGNMVMRKKGVSRAAAEVDDGK